MAYKVDLIGQELACNKPSSNSQGLKSGENMTSRYFFAFLLRIFYLFFIAHNVISDKINDKIKDLSACLTYLI